MYKNHAVGAGYTFLEFDLLPICYRSLQERNMYVYVMQQVGFQVAPKSPLPTVYPAKHKTLNQC